MNTIKNIFIGCIAITSLNSCKKEDLITSYRGKVKFETVSISSKLAGRIDTIYVDEGQEVKKGDTLVFIDIPEVNAKMTQVNGAIRSAKGQLEMAYNGATKEQLDQIKGQLNSGRAQLDFAKQSYTRMQAMYQDSLISQQQFDEVKMKLDMAKAQLDALEAKHIEAKNGARTEQINQAKGQLERAIGVKEEVISASNEKYLIAPTDMSVETISLKKGELLSPGFTIINGYNKNSVYFRFTIPESKIHTFEVGKSLTLINPYTKKEIKAKIAAINQLAHYADITSTAPLYKLSESIYELKIVPLSARKKQIFYSNSTILIKE